MSKQVDAPVIMDIRDMYAISPAEAIEKAKEDTRKQASVNRIPDQDILENHDMAKGNYLDHNELITRIQRLNPRILIHPGGVSGAVAVRYPKVIDGETHMEYVTGFFLKPLPEYSSVTLDKMGLPHRELRGWRSVLNALITAGALDPRKVDILFGPAVGQRSGLWYRSLQAQEKI